MAVDAPGASRLSQPVDDVLVYAAVPQEKCPRQLEGGTRAQVLIGGQADGLWKWAMPSSSSPEALWCSCRAKDGQSSREVRAGGIPRSGLAQRERLLGPAGRLACLGRA